MDNRKTKTAAFFGASFITLITVSYTHLRKADLQVCQFFIRQENILVTAIGVGRVPRFRAYLLYLSLYLYRCV